MVGVTVVAVEQKLEEYLRGKRLVIVWIALTILVGVVSAFTFELPKYLLLTNRGLPTEGLIIELQPLNHGSVIYSYQVEEQPYVGGGHAGDIDSRFDELRAGQRVLVFYDPKKPGICCLGEPSKHLHSLIVLAVFLATSPSLLILALKIRRIFRSTSSSSLERK